MELRLSSDADRRSADQKLTHFYGSLRYIICHLIKSPPLFPKLSQMNPARIIHYFSDIRFIVVNTKWPHKITEVVLNGRLIGSRCRTLRSHRLAEISRGV
jgi:hypothetical protein